MIQITVDGVLAYDSSLDDYDINGLTRTGGLNKGGTAVITMPAKHPAYKSFVSYKTIVEILRDGVLLFRGRPLYVTDDYNNEREVTCEGELCFFRDAVARPYLYQTDPAAIFTDLVAIYNSQVEPFKQFRVGTITVTDPNEYIRLENENAETVMDAINKLLERCGGYIVFTTDSDGVRVVNWLATFNRRNSQEIEFGENLLDFSRDGANTDLCTAVLPYGAKDETTGQRVTIESVNGGLDYIKNEQVAAVRGTIFHYPVWDDVTEPANLLTKAREYLAEKCHIIESLELTALDLSKMDKSLDAFQPGDVIRVRSTPHSVDEDFQLTELTEDLLDPAKGSITLGMERKTLSSTTASQAELQNFEKQIIVDYKVNVAKTVKETETRLSSLIEQRSDHIMLEVSKTYATTTALGEVETTLSSQILQMANSIKLEVSGSLGGSAAVSLTVGDRAMIESLDLSAVRKAFADDDTTVTISAGLITFNSGTIVINSDNFKVDSTGKITATSGTVGGWSLDAKALYYGNSFASASAFFCTGNTNTFTIAGYTTKDWMLKVGNNFGVTSAGVLHCKSAQIYGDIVSESGLYTARLAGGWLQLYYDGAFFFDMSAFVDSDGTKPVVFGLKGPDVELRFKRQVTGTGSSGGVVLVGYRYGYTDSDYETPHIFMEDVSFRTYAHFRNRMYTRAIYMHDGNSIYACDSDGNIVRDILISYSDGLALGDNDKTTMIRGSTVYLKNTSTTVTSDRNAKNSIETLPVDYEKFIDALDPVRFKYNEGTAGRYHVGYIAQDVEAALVAAGLSTMDFAGYVDIERSGNLGLMYDEFIALLHLKIKRLEQRIAALQAAH